MLVRKLLLCAAVVVGAGAVQASASDVTMLDAATLPFTVWNAALSVNTSTLPSEQSDLVRAVILPSRIATATKALDLRKLSLSDFGDVESSHR